MATNSYLLKSNLINVSMNNSDKHKNSSESMKINEVKASKNDHNHDFSEELTNENRALSFQNEGKENRTEALILINKEILFQKERVEKLAAELFFTNQELEIQNKENKQLAVELINANKELLYQNNEKEILTADLILANEELKTAKVNITQLNESLEQKILKRTTQFNFISQINESIVRIKEEETLFRDSCRIANEAGKFKMAWIGMFDTTNKKVSLVNQSGIPYEDIRSFKYLSYQENDPQGYVSRMGSYYISNDVEHDIEKDPKKGVLAKYGIRSCMILPIKKLGTVIGTFNLYSTEINFFGREEITLLYEVTENISFALDIFEKERKHKATEELIVRNEQRFRAIIENSVDMITLSTENGKLLYGSPSVTKQLGYTFEDTLNIASFDFFHPDDIPVVLEKRNELLPTPGGSYHSQIRIKHKNGHWVWCETTMTNLLHEPGINAFVMNFRDISEKRAAEKKQEFDKNNLDALINNTYDLMWSVDRDFKLITSNQTFNDVIKLRSGTVLQKGEDVPSRAFSPKEKYI